MSIQPLTTKSIYETLISQIEGTLGKVVAILPVSFTRVLAAAIAGAVALLYRYGSFIFLQLFVSSASSRTTTINGVSKVPLVEWGRLVGVGDPTQATAAELTVDVTVTTQTGASVLSGTPLVNADTGVTYLTTTGFLLDAATKSINIVAVADQVDGGGRGSIGNLDVGATLQFANPIPDVARDVVVTGTVTQAADAEDLDTVYRQRVLDRFQKPPQGGATADYEGWSEETEGIVNAYVYTGALPGTVEVYCEADPVSSGDPDGIPTTAQLNAALASINLDDAGRATRRPANAFPIVLPITRREFEVVVIGLDAPDPVTVQAAIQTGLVNTFNAFEPYIGGLTVTPRDRITRSQIAGVVHDVASAHGATFSNVRLIGYPDQVQTFTTSVGTGSDDALQVGSAVTLTGAELELIPGNIVGLRFTPVTIPYRATIVSAVLTLTGFQTDAAYSTITIVGQAANDCATFTTAANNLSGRLKTFAVVEWVPDAWALDEERASPDLSAIIQEIVNIGGWDVGHALSLYLSVGAATTARSAHSFDGVPAASARLVVQYEALLPSATDVEVVTLRRGEKAKLVTPVSFP